MKSLVRSTALIVGILFAGGTLAQQATEVYIPIGKSPGVSASQSIIGTITATDYEAYQVTITANGVDTTVTMTERTIYYLDRNHVKQTNGIGSFDDCEIRRRVEARVTADGKVEWIKIATP